MGKILNSKRHGNLNLIVRVCFVVRLGGLLAMTILFLSSAVFAKSTTDISVIALGAKAIGMGRAGVAVSEGNNVFVNPAVIANTQSWDITSMSAQLFGLVDYKLLSGNLKIGKGTVGLSYVGAGSPAGYQTTDENSLTSAVPINYGSSIMALSYGVNLNELFSNSLGQGSVLLGTNLKYYQQGFTGGTLSGASGTGFAVDMGLLLENREGFSFGINVQNIMPGTINWETGTQDEILSLAKIGIASRLWDNHLLLAADADYYITQTEPITAHIGAEWKPVDMLVLRAGLDQDAVSDSVMSNNLCSGVGIDLYGLRIDLAYRQDMTMADNSSFYLSLSYAPSSLVVNESKLQENSVMTLQEFEAKLDQKNADNKAVAGDYYRTVRK